MQLIGSFGSHCEHPHPLSFNPGLERAQERALSSVEVDPGYVSRQGLRTSCLSSEKIRAGEPERGVSWLPWGGLGCTHLRDCRAASVKCEMHIIRGSLKNGCKTLAPWQAEGRHLGNFCLSLLVLKACSTTRGTAN